MNSLFAYALAAIASILITVSSVLESKTKDVYGPIPLAVVIFSTALLSCLLLAWAYHKNPFPTSFSQIAEVGFLRNSGGIARVLYLLCLMYALPELGPFKASCMIVAVQLITSCLIEHYGLLGQVTYKLDVFRLTGGILLIAGTLLVVLKKMV